MLENIQHRLYFNYRRFIHNVGTGKASESAISSRPSEPDAVPNLIYIGLTILNSMYGLKLHVKSKVHDIAILYDISFTF